MTENSEELYDEQEHDPARTRHITGRPRREAQIDALIGAMVQGLGVAEAAEAASMAKSTAYELLQLPEVQDRLRQARGEALAAAARTAAGLATEAVGVLAELMRNAASEGVRRLAADSLLAHATTMGRDAETEAKIAEMNAQIDQLMVEGAVRN